jgi:hypothetical protein
MHRNGAKGVRLNAHGGLPSCGPIGCVQGVSQYTVNGTGLSARSDGQIAGIRERSRFRGTVTEVSMLLRTKCHGSARRCPHRHGLTNPPVIPPPRCAGPNHRPSLHTLHVPGLSRATLPYSNVNRFNELQASAGAQLARILPSARSRDDMSSPPSKCRHPSA